MARTLTPEQRCELLSKRQHGVFHRRQALAFGVNERTIERRLAAGRWRQVLLGVYCLKGTPLSWHAKLMAACLWARGYVSHRSAAVLWGFDGVKGRVIEVSTILRRRPPQDVVVHRVQRSVDLSPIRWKGFEVTDPTRTLIDLAGVVDEVALQAALDSALRHKQTYPDLLLQRLDELRSRGRKGTRLLRDLSMERASGGKPTDSPLEVEAERFLSRYGLNPTERQFWVRGSNGEQRRLDFAWPELKVGIEVDSRDWHEGFSAMEQDVARNNFYVDAGWKVLRFTRRGMKSQGVSLARKLCRLLGQDELLWS